MHLSRYMISVVAIACTMVAPALAQAQDSEAAALTVTVVKPAIRDWPLTAPASGWLKPWHEAIIASEISNLRITDVLVDVGSFVTKGEPLARLSSEALLADLRKDQAAIEIAKAEVVKASANAARARRLQPSGTISSAQLTEDLAAEQAANASLKSAEASLEIQKIRLSQTTIVAVDDGFISSRSAQLGAVVPSGAELFRLVRQSRVEWQAEISARYVSSIKPGLKATVSGLADKRIHGRVRLVGPTLSAETGRAIVFIELPTSEHPPVNFYASGQIELQTTRALTVPETALSFRDGTGYIFTVNAERRVARVRVQSGRRAGGEVEILAGLDQSASVVQSGGAFLSDNSLVEVKGETK